MLDISKNYTLTKVYLGGTGVMYDLVSEGNHYLYKPAIRKSSSIKERSRVQECCYNIQMIVDPESAVWCKYVDNGDIVGCVQERIKLQKNGPNYRDMQWNDSDFSFEQTNQFLREFITDYLTCNFDSHGANFVTDEDGVIRGIDKEQAFKYMRDVDSEFPSITYHPNDMYGEAEPIYNTIFRRYSEGRADIEFSVLDKYMRRVELVDDSAYSEIFKTYCDKAGSSFGMTSSEMLEKIVDRKRNMRSYIETFFNELTNIRNKNNVGGKSNGKI